jgi:diphthamide biosynthesis protein 2
VDQPPSAFSASGEDAITCSIDVAMRPSARRLEASAFSEFYEIQRTADTIINGDFKRVRSSPDDDSFSLMLSRIHR